MRAKGPCPRASLDPGPSPSSARPPVPARPCSPPHRTSGADEGVATAQERLVELRRERCRVVASDAELERTIEGPCLVLNHPEAILTSMNAWSTRQHGNSGLTDRCRESSVTLDEAESALLAFIEKLCNRCRCLRIILLQSTEHCLLPLILLRNLVTNRCSSSSSPLPTIFPFVQYK